MNYLLFSRIINSLRFPKKMKLIIAGGRDFDDYSLLQKEVDKFISIFPASEITIFSGCQRGADKLGEQYAAERLFNIELFPADWNKYGKSAGPIRNIKMAQSATHCICFWDGKSPGTQDMIRVSRKFNMPLSIVNYSK